MAGTVARLGRLAPSPRLVMFSDVVPTSSMKLAQGDASCVVGKVYTIILCTPYSMVHTLVHTGWGDQLWTKLFFFFSIYRFASLIEAFGSPAK